MKHLILPFTFFLSMTVFAAAPVFAVTQCATGPVKCKDASSTYSKTYYCAKVRGIDYWYASAPGPSDRGASCNITSTHIYGSSTTLESQCDTITTLDQQTCEA